MFARLRRESYKNGLTIRQTVFPIRERSEPNS